MCKLLDNHNIQYLIISNCELHNSNLINKEDIKLKVADLQIIFDYYTSIFVKIQVGNKKKNLNQRNFEKKIKAAGSNYIILNSTDECIDFVKSITDKSTFELLLDYLVKQ